MEHLERSKNIRSVESVERFLPWLQSVSWTNTSSLLNSSCVCDRMPQYREGVNTHTQTLTLTQQQHNQEEPETILDPDFLRHNLIFDPKLSCDIKECT